MNAEPGPRGDTLAVARLRARDKRSAPRPERSPRSSSRGRARASPDGTVAYRRPLPPPVDPTAESANPSERASSDGTLSQPHATVVIPPRTGVNRAATMGAPSTATMLKVLGCVTGVVGSLLVYGILQERIMTRPYGEGDDAEKFTFSVFLVMNNRCVSMLVAAIVLAVMQTAVSRGAHLQVRRGVRVNVVATTCQYEALRYVSFPVQTLGKCAKMIPVMIWGYAINGRTYKLADYLVACGVMGGCTLFALYGETTAKDAEGGPHTGFYGGILLMLGYLGFDGFTSTFQDKLFRGYQMETYNQMLWVNFCSALISSFWLFSDSSMGKAVAFIENHPESLTDVLVLSAASTCGQLCILYTIREFGALLFATIMTTRQFLSILLSCVIFMHPLTALQWVGTIMVFASLYYQAFVKQQAKEADAKKEDLAGPHGSTEEKKSLV